MSIRVVCDICDKELNELGALLFSPPNQEVHCEQVRKSHICKPCYQNLNGCIYELRVKAQSQAGRTE